MSTFHQYFLSYVLFADEDGGFTRDGTVNFHNTRR